ncbi:MAG: MvaI/BcnI restriction endonuclease family protein [Treponema sp.]|jgi:hypothetical protein|nr:MvaI/BcnI restriction endonuclease family protein [Treponema sp.]
MDLNNLTDLGKFLYGFGVSRAYFKMLSENDNSKNQIYLGGSFKVLQQLPFGKIREYPETKNPNYKAPVNLWWINDSGQTAQAPNAQMILYTKYPEVRLSGFLISCPTAPGEDFRAIKPEDRHNNNDKDGRVLIFGVCPDGRIFAFLVRKNTVLAKTIINELNDIQSGKTIQEFPLAGIKGTDKTGLLSKLHEIVSIGWHESIRLDTNGNKKPYNAKNGGGYTLEALFGITPNSIAEPDFKGWELKAFSGQRITLITPEPDKGFYHERGAKEFALRYGHDAPNVVKYFTGTHKADVYNTTSNLALVIKGFDYDKGTITDMGGGLHLIDKQNNPVAIWSFNELLTHWGRKHSHACYVHYNVEMHNNKIGYVYLSPVYLGEKTELSLFLKTMQAGLILYDPATKVMLNEKGNTNVKARSQFRINFNNLTKLYERFYLENV